MAKSSERTKSCKKRAIFFFLLSCLCFVGVAIFAVIAAFSHIGGSEKQGMEIISESLKASLISLSITSLIILIAAIIIKEKVRTAAYIISLIIILLIYGKVGAFVVLGIWGVDEYIFHALHKHYKSLTLINKEIDRR